MPLLGLESADAPPEAVTHTAGFLEERGVWFQLGRNHEARSCRDAANKRSRLGEIGIPLWDELKSFFGVIRRDGEQDEYVLLHCRGDRRVDLEAVGRALGSIPERLGQPELDRLGLSYGLVNPFEHWALDGQLITTTVLQVFDTDLVEPIGVPGTVMTNAGDLTWSVELYARELVDALESAVVAAISQPDPEEATRPVWAAEPPTIGIITGNGPESGMMLWRMLNTAVREGLGRHARGDVVMPRVIVRSLPELGLTMELDRRSHAVWPALSKAVRSLCDDGVEIVALACNTTPFFTPQIREITDQHDAKFVSIAEVAGEWLRERDISEIALVGVKTVSDLGQWSPFRDPLGGFHVEIPDDKLMEQIQGLAYEVKARGADGRGLNKLRSILQKGVKAHTVLLALTEISLVLELQKGQQRSERLLVDTMMLYAEALASLYLQGDTAQTSSSRT